MDYLAIYEKFKDIKEVKDYIDDVLALRHYYQTQQFSQMQEHIQKLVCKYYFETVVWNTANPYKPLTVAESYFNAESFLQVQGAIIITKLDKHFAKRLSREEISFIECMIKSIVRKNN